MSSFPLLTDPSDCDAGFSLREQPGARLDRRRLFVPSADDGAREFRSTDPDPCKGAPVTRGRRLTSEIHYIDFGIYCRNAHWQTYDMPWSNANEWCFFCASENALQRLPGLRGWRITRVGRINSTMPFLVRDVFVPLTELEDVVLSLVARRLRIAPTSIRTWSIVRRAIDARKKDVRFCYQVEVALDESPRAEKLRLPRLHGERVDWIEPVAEAPWEAGHATLRERPIIVGFGPGGMFAAIELAERGYRPIVLERGRSVRRRHRDIMQRYYRERDFDPESNLLYGEGGAGTYSDGKLYTRVHDPLCRRVLELFYRFGADPDILINTRPHVGSDKLPTICMRIRAYIESLGGEIRFETQLTDVRIADGVLSAIQVAPSGAASAPDAWIEAGPVILAAGHSARDTLRMLAARGVRIEPKPFQIGVRIEHPQEMVDRWQFGKAAGDTRLGAAEYHLVSRGAVCGRAGEKPGDVFSFCMCPGGVILPSNESRGLVVTNGASRSQRSSPFANSGLVITVDPASWGGDALQAVAWQQHWEELAFAATGESYRVPCQRASDFLAARPSDGVLETSFPLGGKWCDIRTVIPDHVAAALGRALPMWERKFPGFAGADALITAPETRASAPVRVVRDAQTRESLSAAGLYPVGEGAGYAGGIVSAAVDGMKTAHAIIRRYAGPP